uniref:Telomerase RNA component interacting RNase n=1 Tax=Pavo cristatus TaxID=9049 RepID=A0A8C9FT61_PAVCR
VLQGGGPTGWGSCEVGVPWGGGPIGRGSPWGGGDPLQPHHGEEVVVGEAPSPPPGPGGGVNVFANDGSFLELFKRKMEAEQQREREAAAAGGPRAPVSRGGPLRDVLTSKGDAWAKYMAEVKKYKAHQCSDDDKTRPLVK